MKKILSALVAVSIIAGVSAPAFAESQMQNCPFTDRSLCVVESIYSANEAD